MSPFYSQILIVSYDSPFLLIAVTQLRHHHPGNFSHTPLIIQITKFLVICPSHHIQFSFKHTSKAFPNSMCIIHAKLCSWQSFGTAVCKLNLYYSSSCCWDDKHSFKCKAYLSAYFRIRKRFWQDNAKARTIGDTVCFTYYQRTRAFDLLFVDFSIHCSWHKTWKLLSLLLSL